MLIDFQQNSQEKSIWSDVTFFHFLILDSVLSTKIYMLKSTSPYDYIWRQSFREKLNRDHKVEALISQN